MQSPYCAIDRTDNGILCTLANGCRCVVSKHTQVGYATAGRGTDRGDIAGRGRQGICHCCYSRDDLPAKVLDWRQISKLKSTYTDALPTHINAETGRVHTSFSLAATSTGRLASTDPNLQNIPVRTEEGRAIRTAFVADEGNTILSLDYSQIELRILAHIADIPTLKQAFRDGLDIHAMTASEVFGVPLDEMTPDIRRQAKAINFGVIYGISAFGLSNNLRIPRGDAQDFINRYFERFPGIKQYMDDTKAEARETGHVKTLFGRRIHTPNIAAKGPQAGFAARAAINAPIQGTAADVIRRAMIRMEAAIADLPARMLLQVTVTSVTGLLRRSRMVPRTSSPPSSLMITGSDGSVTFFEVAVRLSGRPCSSRGLLTATLKTSLPVIT